MADADRLMRLMRLKRIGWIVTQSGCWEFDGCRNAKGYGKLGLPGRKTGKAHRVSYEAHLGLIPDGMSVLHTCDNPPCINPAHLFVGTIADNNADMHSKGRAVIGEQHPFAKLTDAQVRDIRSANTAGISQHSLSRRYGVAQTTIADIVHLRFRRSASNAA